ncbi:hypothetical protein Tco_1002316, partial [Tanacetum coccineum]
KDDLHFYSPKETILVPSKACIEWDSTDDHFIKDHWFQKLRQFLDKKIWFKELNLHIHVGPIESIKSEVIQWPPIEFEHVELEVEWFEYKSMYELVVDSLLWCCRPQSLTLIIDFSLLKFEEWESVVKLFKKPEEETVKISESIRDDGNLQGSLVIFLPFFSLFVAIFLDIDSKSDDDCCMPLSVI